MWPLLSRDKEGKERLAFFCSCLADGTDPYHCFIAMGGDRDHNEAYAAAKVTSIASRVREIKKRRVERRKHAQKPD